MSITSLPAALSLSLLFCGALWTIAAVNGSSGRARRRVTGLVCITSLAVILLVAINGTRSQSCKGLSSPVMPNMAFPNLT